MAPFLILFKVASLFSVVVSLVVISLFHVYCFSPKLSLFQEHETLSEDVIGVIVTQAIKGLKYLNLQEIQHGNLKASNILLNENGIPRLADFALSLTISNSASISKTSTAKPKLGIYWHVDLLEISQITISIN